MENLEDESNNRRIVQVERELNQTRAYLDRTLTEIEHKLSSSYVKEYATRRAGEALVVGRELVSKYPATTALAATLLLGGALARWGYRRNSASAEWSRMVHHILNEGRRRNGSLNHARILAAYAGQEAGHAARSLAHEAAVQGQDVLGRGKDYAVQQAARATAGFSNARDQQPMMTGLLIGAVLAALGRRVL